MRIETETGGKLVTEVYNISTHRDGPHHETHIPLSLYSVEFIQVAVGGHIPSFQIEGVNGYRNRGDFIARVYLTMDLTHTLIAEYQGARPVKPLAHDVQRVLKNSNLPDQVKLALGLNLEKKIANA